MDDDPAVYDPESDRTTLLDQPAFLLLELSDGERSLEELLTETAQRLSLPTEFLRRRLAELAARQLFVPGSIEEP